MPGKSNDAEHLLRLAALAVLVVGMLLLLRYTLTPPSFGKYGHFRGDAPGEMAKQPIKHAGAQACGTCHQDVMEVKRHSKHKSLSCELCHRPAAAHVADPMAVKPFKPTDGSRCVLCHSKNITRPKLFPQVDVDAHSGGASCLACHKPHRPEMAASR